MRRVTLPLLVSLFSLLLAFPLLGQDDDPSEIFLKAYLSAQQGEKLEREDRFKAALAKLRFAGSLIEELRRSHSDWQPAIVEYRGRKIGQGILRIQERIERHNELTATASPLPEVVPSLPENDGWTEPGPEVVAPQGTESVSQGSNDAAIEEATRKLRRNADQLQAALEKSRSDLETARNDKESVDRRLKETSSKLENAQKEIKASKESEHQVRDELAQAQASWANTNADQLRAQIADLKNKVAVSEEARVTAEKQNEETSVRLAEANKQIVTMQQQRYDALVQLKAGSEMERPLQVPLVEHSDFQPSVTDAEKNAHEADSDGSEKALQQQLVESQKQNQYLVARIAELSVQLDETASELKNAKLTGKNNEETARLMRENELLRNIVVRERREEARRDEARQAMLSEFDKLKIKSDVLNREIEFLAQPVTTLSSEELSLLREPVVSVSDQNRGTLTAGFIFAKKSPGDLVAIEKSDAKAKAAPEGEATMSEPGAFKGDLRVDPQNVSPAGKGSFSSASTGQ